MSGPLVADPNPGSFDAGPSGTIYITGSASALASWQSNAVPGDQSWRGDFSNGQIFVQKTDGWLQFFVDGGAYSLPSLGTRYMSFDDTATDTFGVVPQAYLKIQPVSAVSLEIGKLPSQIGNENAFTFQNVNIDRGLLWNQTPSFTRGMQANYTKGPLNVAISWNDGYYSNRLNWLTGSASYSLNDGIDTFSLTAGANMGRTGYSSFVTPLAQNNSAICDLVYTYVFGAWMIDPYLQFSDISQDTALGFAHDTSTYSAALLASYSFTGELFLAGRIEYIGTSGHTVAGTPNLLYGPGSDAWSITLTPTFQHGIFFARADASYVGASDTTSGYAFGQHLDRTSQTRFMVESGVLF